LPLVPQTYYSYKTKFKNQNIWSKRVKIYLRRVTALFNMEGYGDKAPTAYIATILFIPFIKIF